MRSVKRDNPGDRAAGRKGTAMIEFVLCVPLLATILAGTFFFGWVMRNHQRVRVAARHAAWREVYDESGGVSEEKLNDTFFASRGQNVLREGDGFRGRALEDYVNATGDYGNEAGMIAEEMVENHSPPISRREVVESLFETSSDLWARLASKPIRSGHRRTGRTWRREQWSPLRDTACELLLTDCDAMCESAPDARTETVLRRLYRGGW